MSKILEALKKRDKKHRKLSSITEYVLIIFIVVTSFFYAVRNIHIVETPFSFVVGNTYNEDMKKDIQEKEYDFVVEGNFRSMDEYEKFIKTTENNLIENSSVFRKARLILNEAKPDNIFPDKIKYIGDEIICAEVYAVGDVQYRKYVETLKLDYDEIKDKGIIANFTEPLQGLGQEYMEKIIESKEINGYSSDRKVTIPVGYTTEKLPFGFNKDGSMIIVSDELYDKFFETRIGEVSEDYMDRSDRYFGYIDYKHKYEGIMSFDIANIRICYKAQPGVDLEQLKEDVSNSLGDLRFRLWNGDDIKPEVKIPFDVYECRMFVVLAAMLVIAMIIMANIQRRNSKINTVNKDLEKAKEDFARERNIMLVYGLKTMVTTFLVSMFIISSIVPLKLRVIAFIILVVLYIPIKVNFGSMLTFILETAILMPVACFSIVHGLRLHIIQILVPIIYVVFEVLVSILYERHLIFKQYSVNQHKE